jgi:hypothetical protein
MAWRIDRCLTSIVVDEDRGALEVTRERTSHGIAEASDGFTPKQPPVGDA